MDEKTAVSMALRKPMTPEQYIHAKRAYLEAIAPYIKMQVDILNMQPVQYILERGSNPLGTLPIAERKILWDTTSKATYDQITELIEHIRQSYFPEM